MSRNRKSHRNFLFLRFFFVLPLLRFSLLFSSPSRLFSQRERRNMSSEKKRKTFSPLYTFSKWFSLYVLGKFVAAMSSTTSETPVSSSSKKHVLYPSTSQQSTVSSPSKPSMASGSGQQQSKSSSSAPKHHSTGSQNYIQQQQQTMHQPPPNPHQYYSLRWNNYQS